VTLSDGATLGYQPNATDLRIAAAALAGWRAYTSPHYVGLENIPTDGAVLLAGNHTTLGVLDAPLMVVDIHRERGRWVRGLAETAHYRVPGFRELLARLGAVRGTQANCRALLANREAVLVDPGGGREVAKRKGEKYQLIWKERLGFARLAIESGCPIVPFAAVGAEESFDIVLDADHPWLTPARLAVESLGGRWELAPPLVRGIGPTPLPRPQRYYFSFGAPIGTTRWHGRHDSETAARELRDQVRSSVEDQLAALLTDRAADNGRET
jgi:1-acyl-sn-glycerol-3-phosphate acyltransferase